MKTLTTIFVGSLLLATPSMQASSAQSVPFEATYEGTFTIAGPLLTFNGGGPATHLGNSTVTGTSLLVPDLVDPLCFNIVQDAVTLRAANGDELHLVNEGQDCLDPVAGTITGIATTTVVGGSGRFAGATGSGTATVEAQVLGPTPDGVMGTFVLRFEGQISAPGTSVD